MAKPILIIRFPNNSIVNDCQRSEILQFAKSATIEEYHVIGFTSNSISDIHFEIVGNEIISEPYITMEQLEGLRFKLKSKV